MSKIDIQTTPVDSGLGKQKVDNDGEIISGVRLDTNRAYGQIPELLQEFINQGVEAAWVAIADKIDYIYDNLDYAMTALNEETGFGDKICNEIKKGKKLLFKPNLVAPSVIDPETHGEGPGAAICTEWPLVAALMRWLHDKFQIKYWQMCLGEASTSTYFFGVHYSKIAGRLITPEAVIEGRSGDFYGGWGFYFVRKYLAYRQPPDQEDDPMKGYEDSTTGKYIPPGRTGDRLMVYDLNQLGKDGERGRTVPVPCGVNFKSIMLHKAIIGGNPKNREDLRSYPGSVLVNVPKLKMHAQDLITNAIKNLGIGLYPGDKYASPGAVYPSLKGKLPHSPWIFEMDETTHLPIKDECGRYICKKTGGFSGTQTDIIKAVQCQNVFMIHVDDAINMLNISHNPDGRAVRIPEGYIFASLDCVALDFFCARYCFNMLPMAESLKLKQEYCWSTEFVQKVPYPKIDGKNICNSTWYDSPLFRYDLFRFAEERGIGQKKYQLTGWDSMTQTPLASLLGHLGRVEQGEFIELITKTLYYNPDTIIFDLQLTVLSYAKACDTLTCSSVFEELMDTFDENKDCVIDYDEKGRGFETALFSMTSQTIDTALSEEFGIFKGSFIEPAFFLKNSNPCWNPESHDFSKEKILTGRAVIAFELSYSDTVRADLFIPGMSFGKGMWPSWQTAIYMQVTNTVYGSQSPKNISLTSLYGNAFQYADIVFNNGEYTGNDSPSIKDSQRGYGSRSPVVNERDNETANAINKYFKELRKGAPLLKFILYVPEGYGSLEGCCIPNVEETADPSKILTVQFKEIW